MGYILKANGLVGVLVVAETTTSPPALRGNFVGGSLNKNAAFLEWLVGFFVGLQPVTILRGNIQFYGKINMVYCKYESGLVDVLLL